MKKRTKSFLCLIVVFQAVIFHSQAQLKHNIEPRYSSYEGLVMAGYQGWFRTPKDGSGSSWVHYGDNGKFDKDHNTIDFWPDVSDYPRTYDTEFLQEDGTEAKVFSSIDKSTTDLHFQWMKEYGVSGVFMQRFFNVAKKYEDKGKSSDIILKNASLSAEKYDRAFAVMYDLSGLNPKSDDCSAVIEDWKMLVDELKVTQSKNYLNHNKKPLVAIWGLGFPDRPYDIRDIGINRLIDFLKNDPEYGGCAVMLGVPTYFRELDKDCLPDPYLHEVIRSADIVLPWMVQRFTPLLHQDELRYRDHVIADIRWCQENNVDYVPLAYPGFSWHNLSKNNPGLARHTSYGAIPRLGGEFYWDLLYNSIQAGASMIYVAMFDEIDEGTAIIPVLDSPPNSEEAQFVGNDGVDPYHYLRLTGLAGQMLRKEIPLQAEMPKN
ncbi:glycoside hydrolase family 71/99-like protein [Reichenbachiella ulvae]|uniref:Glycoside hydrolase family 71/99-like protein n=1 Tax=Reichenbachiella ulvae TaxID=2980104 RepID=A0ABT3CNX1_9BACT|nr:glycoside hydrolase family 71/99-like protein [Reichenbachiella ulvae]MCV9385261.1 glycoside hydrolase family 71/99-like protein [Reichenbachiella ulvae]